MVKKDKGTTVSVTAKRALSCGENSEFSPVLTGAKYSSHIRYVEKVAAFDGVGLFMERGYNEHIHRDARIPNGRYAIAVDGEVTRSFLSNHEVEAAQSKLEFAETVSRVWLVACPASGLVAGWVIGLSFWMIPFVVMLVISTVFVAKLTYNLRKNQIAVDESQKENQFSTRAVGEMVMVNDEFARIFIHLSKGKFHECVIEFLVSTFKLKIADGQDSAEAADWMNHAVRILEIDEKFPMDLIPAMAVDAAEIAGKVERAAAEKVFADGLMNEAVTGEKNKSVVDDSTAVKAGALAYLGETDND